MHAICSYVEWKSRRGKKSKEKCCQCLWASRYHSSVATQIVFKQLGISYQVLQIKFEMHSQMWKDSTLWSQSPGWFLHKFLQKAIESWHQIIHQMKYIYGIWNISYKHKNELYFSGSWNILHNNFNFLKSFRKKMALPFNKNVLF